MSSEIVNGIAEAIGGSIRSLNDAMTALRQSVEQKNQELNEAVNKLTERVEYAEKSQYDRLENISRSGNDKLESNLRNHVESATRTGFDRQDDMLTKNLEQLVKSQNTLLERISDLEKKVDSGSEVFKSHVKEATSEAIESFQQNPSPVDTAKKSSGNQSFNDVEQRQQEARIIKNNDGDLVVKEENINPMTLTDQEMKALNKEQQLDALNAAVGQMMGFGR